MQFFKNKSKKFIKTEAPQVPRSIEDINKAYSEELAKAGQHQYLVYVYTKELEQSNKNLLSLNQEAAARNALDKQASEAPKESTEQTNGATP